MRLPFLRKSAGETPLVVSMSGVRLGDAVLFAGRSPELALPLAARTGLSGRCLVVGTPELTVSLAEAAIKDGLLVETADRFPADRSFELAVVQVVDDWAGATAGARDAVRGGGRVLVVAGLPPSGWLSRLRAAPPEVAAADIVATLQSQRWQRVRSIGQAGGLTFVEAFA